MDGCSRMVPRVWRPAPGQQEDMTLVCFVQPASPAPPNGDSHGVPKGYRRGQTPTHKPFPSLCMRYIC